MIDAVAPAARRSALQCHELPLQRVVVEQRRLPPVNERERVPIYLGLAQLADLVGDVKLPKRRDRPLTSVMIALDRVDVVLPQYMRKLLHNILRLTRRLALADHVN